MVYSKGSRYVLVHVIYADDFLHFSNKISVHAGFREQLKKWFDIKTGPVYMDLGNKIRVDPDRFNALINQTEYITDLSPVVQIRSL